MEITKIKTENLFNHPNNPRTDYGDLTELTESIKEQGVLEPLIVVKLSPVMERYNVVAGNRRLRAAREAGLEELPCIIQNLSDKDQASIMLTENMQRKNLNPYEECQGVQMCLELGMTEDELSKKTGFSKSTIRQRKKLGELDQKLLKEKCKDGQITLKELESLERIKDVETRNKVLEKAGTNNFNYEVQKAVNEEAAEENRKATLASLSAFAILKDTDWKDDNFEAVERYISSPREMPEDTDETEYVFQKSWPSAENNWTLYKRREEGSEDEESEEEDGEIEYNSRWEKQKDCKAKLEELGTIFFKMRKKYMQFNKEFKGNLIQWLSYLIIADFTSGENIMPGYNWAVDGNAENPDPDPVAYKIFGEMMDAEKPEDTQPEDMLNDLVKYPEEEKEIAMVIIYSMLETADAIPAHYDGSFDEADQTYRRLYDFMQLCGYELSDAEKQILDGTHEYYYREDEA